MLRTGTIVCILFVLLGMSMQSCNIINPKETTPTYIHIDSFRTKPGFSHKIAAVWVYYNNSPVGVFDLPATFPVNATGSGKLLFMPGVPVDGQYSLMANYAFYTSDTLTINEQPGKIITYQPFTDYYPGRTEVKISDFENSVGFAKSEGNVGLTLVPASNPDVLNGNAGGIFLNAVGDSSVDTTVLSFTIPAGRSAFIEFDYRTTIPFLVGLEGTLAGLITTGPYYLAGIKPNDQWQKFYLNVQAFATQYNATYYHMYIKGVLAPEQTSGRMLIDNIKLLYF